MNLVSLKNEVDAAKELLAQAEEAYKKGIVEAAQSGILAERKTAMWQEVFCAAEGKTKAYCDGCGYYSPIKSDFCPKCGAKMANPSMYVPKQASAWLQRFDEDPLVTLYEIDNKDYVKEKIIDISEIVPPNEWEKKSKAEKQALTVAVCDRLIKRYGTAEKASMRIGKCGEYLSVTKSKIRKYDSVPRYDTYYFIARAK